jgi:hypothetical protein
VWVVSAVPCAGLAGWMLGLAASWFFLSFWLVFSACILLAFRFCFFYVFTLFFAGFQLVLQACLARF